MQNMTVGKAVKDYLKEKNHLALPNNITQMAHHVVMWGLAAQINGYFPASSLSQVVPPY